MALDDGSDLVQHRRPRLVGGGPHLDRDGDLAPLRAGDEADLPDDVPLRRRPPPALGDGTLEPAEPPVLPVHDPAHRLEDGLGVRQAGRPRHETGLILGAPPGLAEGGEARRGLLVLDPGAPVAPIAQDRLDGSPGLGRCAEPRPQPHRGVVVGPGQGRLDVGAGRLVPVGAVRGQGKGHLDRRPGRGGLVCPDGHGLALPANRGEGDDQVIVRVVGDDLLQRGPGRPADLRGPRGPRRGEGGRRAHPFAGGALGDPFDAHAEGTAAAQRDGHGRDGDEEPAHAGLSTGRRRRRCRRCTS